MKQQDGSWCNSKKGQWLASSKEGCKARHKLLTPLIWPHCGKIARNPLYCFDWEESQLDSPKDVNLGYFKVTLVLIQEMRQNVVDETPNVFLEWIGAAYVSNRDRYRGLLEALGHGSMFGPRRWRERLDLTLFLLPLLLIRIFSGRPSWMWSPTTPKWISLLTLSFWPRR